MHDSRFVWTAVQCHCVAVKIILLLSHLSSSNIGIGNSPLCPADVVQAEGLNGTFLCQLPTDSGSIEWQTNGVSLRNSNATEAAIIREGRGESTEALVIPAIPNYNGSSVVCILYIIQPNGTDMFIDSTPATLTVQGALEAVSKLSSWSTSSFIQLTWKPPFSLNLTTAEPDIVYCVDIFNITAGELEKEHLISNCSVFESRYYFTVDNPDPRDLFQFTITPRSNVEEARNGTSSQVYTTFSFEKPQILPLKGISVEVNLQDDQTVEVMIKLTDNSLLSGPRIPEMYEFSFNSVIEHHQQQISNAYPIEDYEYENCIELTLNNSLIQPYNLYVMNITASNPAGRAVIIQDWKLSTHYIQDINVTSSITEPGQINISCRFLVNSSLAMGYLAIIYSQKGDVNYLITENQDQDFMINMLTGLSDKEYSVLLYTIDKSGLPLKQAAGFPQTVFVDNQLVNDFDFSGSGEMPGSVLNVSATVLRNETNLCVYSSFHDDSASACVVIYYGFADNSNDLITLNLWKIDRVEQEAYGCVDLRSNPDSISDNVAIFAFSSEKKMIYGQPLNISKSPIKNQESTTDPDNDLHSEFSEPTDDVSNMTTLYVIIALCAVAVTLCILAVGIILVKVVYHRRKISNRAQIMEPNVYATNTTCTGIDPDTIIYSDIQEKQTETATPDNLTTVIYSEIQPSNSAGNTFRIQTTPPTQHEVPSPSEPHIPIHQVFTIENIIPKLTPMVCKWKEIGEALHFDEDRLDEIFTNNETDEACLETMLEFYLKNSDFDHNWEEIDRAVKIAGEEGPGMDGYNENYGSDTTDPKMFIDNEKDDCQMGTL